MVNFCICTFFRSASKKFFWSYAFYDYFSNFFHFLQFHYINCMPIAGKRIRIFDHGLEQSCSACYCQHLCSWCQSWKTSFYGRKITKCRKMYDFFTFFTEKDDFWWSENMMTYISSYSIESWENSESLCKFLTLKVVSGVKFGIKFIWRRPLFLKMTKNEK